ncbi:hypothetical protein RB653_005817 [Dictyostelium firmibasis]|uniref:Proteasome activator PA28 C-terminal domain-containing protein n=1 Tax=Dictyostelium firmibasis TaxID=79012 RepID=A0AAN7YTA2_9MYCE
MSKLSEIKMDERVLAYKQDLYEKTKHHLNITIPKKIVEFRELAEANTLRSKIELSKTTSTTTTTTAPDGGEEPSKKRKLDLDAYENALPSLEELLKTNPAILETHTIFKKYYIETIEIFSVIRGWITLNIPRVEDGNNFGVDIQEDIISQITKVEECYTTLLEYSENYHLTRAELVRKALKHKDIDSYRFSIAKLDEKESFKSNFGYHDLAQNYATAYSVIVKNFSKLETPRPTNASNIY